MTSAQVVVVVVHHREENFHAHHMGDLDNIWSKNMKLKTWNQNK